MVLALHEPDRSGNPESADAEVRFFSMTAVTVLEDPPCLSVSGLGAGIFLAALMRYRERQTIVVIHIRPQAK